MLTWTVTQVALVHRTATLLSLFYRQCTWCASFNSLPPKLAMVAVVSNDMLAAFV